MRDVILHLKTLDTQTVPREMAREIAVLSLNEAKQQITPPAPNAPYPQKERYVELVNLSRPVSERVTPTPETIDRVIRDLTPTTPISSRPIESESRQAMPLPPINGKQVM